MGKHCQTLFGGAPKSLWMMTTAKKFKDSCSLEESYDKAKQHIKKQRHHFANKGHLVKAMVFPVAIYGCESWDSEES